MRRQLIVFVALAALVVGCDAVTTPSGAPLLASVDPASAEVSPSAEPATEELAALYSTALATANKANEEDSRLWIKSSKDFDAAKARASRRARATLTFLRTVEELPWPSEVEPTVRRLVKCENTVYDYQENASIGKSRKELTGISAVRKYLALAGRMGAKCTVLANKLEHELGLAGLIGGPNCGSLLWIDGYLVADNGRVILAESQGDRSGTPLTWPDGWTVRPIDGGQLEIVDVTGTVHSRTGEGIVFTVVTDTGGPVYSDGALEVCPPPWPDNYMDPDYSPPPPPGVVETP